MSPAPRLLGSFLLLVGCAPGGDSGAMAAASEGAVLLPESWRLALAADDPWAAEAPEGSACPSTAYGTEGDFFEVETDTCAWGTWTQPLGDAVAAGDRLSFTFFHLDLWAPEPAEAVVVLQFGDETVWSLQSPVPAEAAVYEVELEAAEDRPHGQLARFHVHNHGSNSYRLGPVGRGPAPIR